MSIQVITVVQDSLFPVKLAVNPNLEMTLPRRQVQDLLAALGYKAVHLRAATRTNILEMRNGDGGRAFLAEKELVFDHALPPKIQEQLHAQVYSLLVARIRILNQAARQNAGAAKLNLLQNQRRAAASDAYYALFTALGSLIEYTKQSLLTQVFSAVDQDALSEDPEDRRDHFTPDLAERVAGRWKDLVKATLDKKAELGKNVCRFPSIPDLSRRNSFMWLILTGTQLLVQSTAVSSATGDEAGVEGEEISEPRSEEKADGDLSWRALTEEFVGAVATRLAHVRMESFAIGVSGRESFEEQFTTLFQQLWETGTSGRNSTNAVERSTGQLALLACLFLYSYTLRQMADYETSFDSRIGVQEIGNICYLADRFSRIVESYTSRQTELGREPAIDQLSTVCSIDLIPNVRGTRGSDAVLYMMGGVAIGESIDLERVAKQLLDTRVYSPGMIDGRLCTSLDGQLVVPNRGLPLTNLQLRFTINASGLIWVDVVGLRGMNRNVPRPEDFSSYVLERMLVEKILPAEILPTLPHGTIVYLGALAGGPGTQWGMFEFISNLQSLRSSVVRMRLSRLLTEGLRDACQLSVVPPDQEISIQWLYSESDVVYRSPLHDNDGATPPKLIVLFHLYPLEQTEKQNITSKLTQALQPPAEPPLFYYVDKPMLDDLLSGDDGALSSKVASLVETISSSYASWRRNAEDEKRTEGELKGG
ncbi:MAG: hypothetical protein ACYC5Y_07050 [Symbiobacteriia bacterium]